MCSVVGGVISKETWVQNRDQLNELVFTALTRKGYDGFTCKMWYGQRPYPRNNVMRYASYDPKEVLNFLNGQFDLADNEDLTFMMFGRAAPETEALTTTTEQLQPFSTSSGIFSIHHGLVSNYQELVEGYAVVTRTTIDSEVIPWVIETLAQNNTLNKFSEIVKGSHSILYYRNGDLGYINNYLGLWGIKFGTEFKIGERNKNFIVYNTDLSKLYNDQFTFPLYSQAIIGGAQ